MDNRKANVKELRRLARHTRHLLLCAVAIGSVATATALAVAPAASAETDYSCEKCVTTSGPNEWMDYVGGTIYSGAPEGFLEIWKYNGGTNYSEVWWAEIPSYELHVEHCLGYEHRVNGHGTTHVYEGESAHISGKEWLWNNKEGPC